MAGWAFWIDRGGTFTDIVARRPDGTLAVAKLLSEDPERYTDAAVEGVRRLMDVGDGPLPVDRIEAVKMGTTVATNALLERRGEPTVLAITSGHADALHIGYQNRPRLFDLDIVLPERLYARVVEIDERMSAQGEVLRPLDLDRARADLEAAFQAGFRAVAVVLMHGYRFTDHESRVADLAHAVGFTQVSVSHDVSPSPRLIARGDTTVADAYLSPVLGRYVAQVGSHLGEDTRLLFMQSNGGLVDALHFRGRDAILSGPAGGVVGMVKTARKAGFDRVIGFDMGGTSTDVSHYAGEYERTYDSVVAGVRVRAPMMHIHTVAAGGGSICRFDGSRLRVGPQSAGAMPGPACYRRGGPLTVTDCNVLLGRIQPADFPAVFGLDGDQPLDLDGVRALFSALADEVEHATGQRRAPEELAEGFLTVAVENIANAIKTVSVQRGYDATAYVLACFGGAAGQHACMVADALGMRRVMIHPLASVLSAYGMGQADLRVVREAPIDQMLCAELGPRLLEQANGLCAQTRSALQAQGVAAHRIETIRHALLKYSGTDTALPIPLDAPETMRTAFEALHRQRFGFVMQSQALLVDALSVEAIGSADPQDAAPGVKSTSGPSVPSAQVQAHMGGPTELVPVYRRADLGVGACVPGPAIVSEATSTTVVEAGWTASVDGLANLLLERTKARTGEAVGVELDPVRLEVFNNLFMAIAEQMGAALRNTAYSVNIKERLDFSCALFDHSGALIANAPHIPVHLGSMGDGVKTVIARRGEGRDERGMLPGDVYMLNAPYDGGTHLPDVTVIMPVFDEAIPAKPALPAPLFYVAARGHHADIGGLTPGSMPPHSRLLEEEGVLIDNVLLLDQGRFMETETRVLLASSPYPARNLDQNIGDLKAQIAACAKGAGELHRIVRQYGREVVQAYMAHVQDNAEEAVRRVLPKLKGGAFDYELDNGAVVSVRIVIDPAARSAIVDFTGSSDQLPTNFNAPFSVCRAAVLYVFRTLVADDIPLNDGCLRPITIVAQPGSMLNPRYPAAVAAGNVETSQVVTDALYGALGVLAAAQGSMNNLTFGDATRQYYETICGGAGASAEHDGASAVQTHMTNSRSTDPEVLESRFPVLVDAFKVRRGSGGAGRRRGGDGVVRRLVFREALTAVILSNRRRVPPFGLCDGEPGAPGRNRVERRGGAVEELGSTAAVDLQPGDAMLIETPGGGGYGRSDP